MPSTFCCSTAIQGHASCVRIRKQRFAFQHGKSQPSMRCVRCIEYVWSSRAKGNLVYLYLFLVFIVERAFVANRPTKGCQTLAYWPLVAATVKIVLHWSLWAAQQSLIDSFFCAKSNNIGYSTAASENAVQLNQCKPFLLLVRSPILVFLTLGVPPQRVGISST